MGNVTPSFESYVQSTIHTFYYYMGPLVKFHHGFEKKNCSGLGKIEKSYPSIRKGIKFQRRGKLVDN